MIRALILTALLSASLFGQELPDVNAVTRWELRVFESSQATVDAMNKHRRERGIAPLRNDFICWSVARKHCRWMADHGALAHLAEYKWPWDRNGKGEGNANENIGTLGNIPMVNGRVQFTSEHAFEPFIESPGHFKNILDPRWTRVGISFIYSQENERLFIVHYFER